MSYFEREAKSYMSRSQSGLWSRVRLIESAAIIEELSPQPGEKILDVGCGAGFYSKRLQKLGAQVSGIDSSPSMLEQFRALGLRSYLGEFESFEFDCQFDKVLMAGSAEFMDDVEAILLKLQSVLVPGGQAVILAPRGNLWGNLYKYWHRTHGTTVALHNYGAALRRITALRLRSTRNVTPMSCILTVERVRI